MDASDFVDFTIFISEENCALGTVWCRKCCTYVDIHCEIVGDEIIEYPFDFIFPIRITLNTRKKKNMKPTTKNVAIKRKLGTLVVEPLQSYVMEGKLIFENIRGNVEEIEEPMHK